MAIRKEIVINTFRVYIPGSLEYQNILNTFFYGSLMLVELNKNLQETDLKEQKSNKSLYIYVYYIYIYWSALDIYETYQLVLHRSQFAH